MISSLLQVQARALRGLGAALLPLCSSSHSGTEKTAALDAFLESVDGASRATEPTEMRAAAVQALHASSLLQTSSAGSSEPPLNCRFVMFVSRGKSMFVQIIKGYPDVSRMPQGRLRLQMRSEGMWKNK